MLEAIFIVVLKDIVDNDEWSIQVSGCQESTVQSIFCNII